MLVLKCNDVFMISRNFKHFGGNFPYFPYFLVIFRIFGQLIKPDEVKTALSQRYRNESIGIEGVNKNQKMLRRIGMSREKSK